MISTHMILLGVSQDNWSTQSYQLEGSPVRSNLRCTKTNATQLDKVEIDLVVI